MQGFETTNIPGYQRPVKVGAVGPNAAKLEVQKTATRLNGCPDDENVGDYWPLILRRNDNGILKEHGELCQETWYVRNLIRIERQEDDLFLEQVRKRLPGVGRFA